MHTPRCLQYRLNHSRFYYTTLGTRERIQSIILEKYEEALKEEPVEALV